MTSRASIRVRNSAKREARQRALKRDTEAGEHPKGYGSPVAGCFCPACQGSRKLGEHLGYIYDPQTGERRYDQERFKPC